MLFSDFRNREKTTSKMKSIAFAMGVWAAVANASELTKETWDDAVAAKTVFVKFQAPW